MNLQLARYLHVSLCRNNLNTLEIANMIEKDTFTATAFYAECKDVTRFTAWNMAAAMLIAKQIYPTASKLLVEPEKTHD